MTTRRHSTTPTTLKVNYKIDTILFDLDDTLIVEWTSAEESFIETILQIDSQIDTEKFLKTIREEAKKQWYNLPTIDFCLKIGISAWEALWADFTGDNENFSKLRELSEKYRFNTWKQTLIKFNVYDEKLAGRLCLDFKRKRNTKHVLYPETIEVLTKLQGRYKIGLITNGAPDLQWKKISGGNIKQYFNFIAISGEHGYAKPDKRLFDVILNGLKSSKERTIIIGDSLNTDIKGGLDYGLKTLWINRDGRKTGKIKPDYKLTSLVEIEKIITLL